jgi:hypothetical protein
MSKKLPNETDDIVRIDDIKIPTEFSILVPSREKMNKKAAYYDKQGVFDKPIVVIPEINEKGFPNKLVLVDGYINYIIALCRNEEYIPVKYQFEYIV